MTHTSAYNDALLLLVLRNPLTVAPPPDMPNRYLKSPPFSEMNFMAAGWVLCQCSLYNIAVRFRLNSHMCVGGPLEANIGVVYVQNAAPDGPVAWMFAEVPDRLLRWARDCIKYLDNKAADTDNHFRLTEGGARRISSSHLRRTLS